MANPNASIDSLLSAVTSIKELPVVEFSEAAVSDIEAYTCVRLRNRIHYLLNKKVLNETDIKLLDVLLTHQDKALK